MENTTVDIVSHSPTTPNGWVEVQPAVELERKHATTTVANDTVVKPTEVATASIPTVSNATKEFEETWRIVQEQPQSSCPQWSPDERTDIQKSAMHVWEKRGFVPMSFFSARFGSASILVHRPYHFRILAHLIDFNNASEMDIAIYLSLVNKYHLMGTVGDTDFKAFANYFKSIYEQWKEHKLPAASMPDIVVQPSANETSETPITAIALPPAGDVPKPAPEPETKPKDGVAPVPEVVFNGQISGLTFVLSSSPTPTPDAPQKQATAPVVAPVIAPPPPTKLSLAQIKERIQRDCPQADSWKREHMKKVEMCANVIRPECGPVRLYDVREYREAQGKTGGDWVMCMFNLVDLTRVDHDTFDKFQQNGFGPRSRLYLRYRYAVINETIFGVRDIQKYVEENCPHAAAWSVDEMCKIEEFASAIRDICEPVVTLNDVRALASAKDDHYSCMFNLVNFTNVTKKEFDAFKLAFSASGARAYFTRRYYQANNAPMQFVDMEQSTVKQTIMDESPDANDWSKESLQRIEAVADKLLQRHGRFSWSVFDAFQEHCTSLNHVSVAFNLVEFKSANVKSVNAFIMKQQELFMPQYGDYLMRRYHAICAKLAPAEVAPASKSPAQEKSPTQDSAPPQASPPALSSSPPSTSTVIAKDDPNRLKIIVDLLESGPIFDLSAPTKAVEFARSVELKTGKITLDEFEKLAILVGDNSRGQKIQALAWPMVDYNGLDPSHIEKTLRLLNYSMAFRFFAIQLAQASKSNGPTNKDGEQAKPKLTIDAIVALVKECPQTPDWSRDSEKRWEAFAESVRPQIGSITLDQYKQMQSRLRMDARLAAWTLIDFQNVTQQDAANSHGFGLEGCSYCLRYYEKWKSARTPSSTSSQSPRKLDWDNIVKLITACKCTSSWSKEDREAVQLYAESIRPVTGSLSLDEFIKFAKSNSVGQDDFVAWTLVDFAKVTIDVPKAFESGGQLNGFIGPKTQKWCIDYYNEVVRPKAATQPATTPTPPLTKEEIDRLVDEKMPHAPGCSDEEWKKLDDYAETLRPRVGFVPLEYCIGGVNRRYVLFNLVNFTKVSKDDVIKFLSGNECGTRFRSRYEFHLAAQTKATTTLTKDEIYRLAKENRPDSNTWSDNDCAKLDTFAETLRPRIGFVPLEYCDDGDSPNRNYTLFNLVDMTKLSSDEFAKFLSNKNPEPRRAYQKRYDFHLKRLSGAETTKTATADSATKSAPTRKMDSLAIWDFLLAKYPDDGSCPYQTKVTRAQKYANDVRDQIGPVTFDDIITIESTYGGGRRGNDKCSNLAFFTLVFLVDLGPTTMESRYKFFDKLEQYNKSLISTIGHILVTVALQNGAPPLSSPPPLCAMPSAPPPFSPQTSLCPSSAPSAPSVIVASAATSPPPPLQWNQIVDLIKAGPRTNNWDSAEMAKVEQYADSILPRTGFLSLCQFACFLALDNTKEDQDCVAFNLLNFSVVTDADVKRVLGVNPNRSFTNYCFNCHNWRKQTVRTIPTQSVCVVSSPVLPPVTAITPPTTTETKHVPSPTPRMEWAEIEKLIRKCPSTKSWSRSDMEKLEVYAASIRPKTGFISLEQFRTHFRDSADPGCVAWNLVEFTNVSDKMVEEFMKQGNYISEFRQYAIKHYQTNKHTQVAPVDIATASLDTASLGAIQSICHQPLNKFTADQRATILCKLRQFGFAKKSHAFLDHLRQCNGDTENQLSLMNAYILPIIVPWQQADEAIVSEIVKLCYDNKWKQLVEVVLGCVENVFSRERMAKWRTQFICPNVPVWAGKKAYRKVQRLF